MKSLLFYLFLSATFSWNSFADIQIESAQIKLSASDKITYSFLLRDDKTLVSITDKDLMETHTKVLHLIVYDLSLNVFNHVHPQFENGQWSVELDLTVNGTYFIWAQGETISGDEFSVYRFLEIENGSVQNPIQPLGDVRTGIDGATQIELANTKIKSGKMVMINFKVTRTDGTIPSLSPYLGAFAHVIATPFNGAELIHVHPMEGSDPTSGMLHATFPLAGEYRLWIQLNDGGELKTIPLSVVVK